MKGGNDLQPGELDLENEGPEYFTHVAGGETSQVDHEGYSIPGHSGASSPTRPPLRAIMSPTLPERKKKIDESAGKLRKKLINLFKYKNESSDQLDGENLKLTDE